MARHRGRLTAAFVQKTREPGKYCDDFGLIFRVYASGAKCWEQRLSIGGRRRTLGLGGWPVVTLAAARDKALDNLRTVRSGGDPLASKVPVEVPTLADAMDAVIEKRKSGWRSPNEERIWRQRLGLHVLPVLGDRPVSQIDVSDVVRVLEPLYEKKCKRYERPTFLLVR